MRRTDDGGFKIETAKCLGQTDKAIKVEAPAFDAPTWIPKSQVHDDILLLRSERVASRTTLR